MGLPQWQGWGAVHSVNGFKDYSGGLSTVYVSRCDNKNVGGPNIVDLATHMANYQPVLIELQVRGSVYVSRCHKKTDGRPNIVNLATHMAKDLQKLIMTMGLPQWQGWAAVHSANGFKDDSRALSTVYVAFCHENTDGRPNIVDVATHMAKYQLVLIELQNEFFFEFSGNAGGSGENCGF